MFTGFTHSDTKGARPGAAAPNHNSLHHCIHGQLAKKAHQCKVGRTGEECKDKDKDKDKRGVCVWLVACAGCVRQHVAAVTTV